MIGSIITQFIAQFTNATIRHRLYNYSGTEVGLHHPDLPSGIVFRDQGQTDVYSGKSRLVMRHNGGIVLWGSAIGVAAETISLLPKDIKSLKILGKHFAKDWHDQTVKAITVKDPAILQQFTVIDPTKTFVDPHTMKIVNDVPLSEVFLAKDIFERDLVDKHLPPLAVETYKYLASKLEPTNT